MHSASFGMEKVGERALYLVDHNPPKAEVTGSNPVGCAINVLNCFVFLQRH